MIEKKRTIQSFVRRNGRMTSSQKQALMTLWTRYGVTIPESGVWSPHACFESNSMTSASRPLIVEIGFGMGHSLLAMAKQFPQSDFIGIDVYQPGVGAVLHVIEAQSLHNVRLICDDAVRVLAHLPGQSLDAVLIFFPDPWQKNRHHKRRLIQSAFVERIQAVLKPGGYLHIATDWQPYAEHIAQVLGQFPKLCEVAESLSHCMPRVLTKFEQRGQKLGHAIFEFMRVLRSC